MTLYEMN
jgi:hypothetical protein